MRVNILFLTGFLWLILSYPVWATSPIRSWATDMYNQSMVKSFEKGGMLRFPVGSVTTDGIVIRSDGINNDYGKNLPWSDFSADGFRYNPAVTLPNPIKKDERSLSNGEYMYLVNCRACHGAQGKSETNIGKLRAVPVIDTLVPDMTDGYLYLRITYGGSILTSMPPYGYNLSEQERWDVVNYIKNKFK
ncbi:MAG: c-type cytochrome [SAR324 cluster bacterium]|nr:c-type cytochrome [SAR324 cluster bacterium]